MKSTWRPLRRETSVRARSCGRDARCPSSNWVSGNDLSTYMARHQSGDWGEIDAHDRKENELSLEQGFRLMSVYTLSITGVKIWIITEADRSSTCILLPEEY